MLTVQLPADHYEEYAYVADVMLGEFLGLAYRLELGESGTADCTIELPNGNRLVIENHFFRRHRAPLGYLDKANIPETVRYVSQGENPFLVAEDLPMLFGKSELEIRSGSIRCGIDIVAAVFFMLSRWEELVVEDRDRHGRFPARAALACRGNFIQRPVVNEYLELLWNMLKHLGIGEDRKVRHFEAVITHDVDFPLMWNGPLSLLRKLGGSLLKRLDLAEARYYLRNYRWVSQGRERDPFDTFDRLMTLAEAQGLRAHFFFLCGGAHPLDNRHSFPEAFYRRLVPDILGRGHRVGLHPSYESLRQPELLVQEKRRLEEFIGCGVSTGRQHFLRFEVPATWQDWEDAGMDWDSSLYYADMPGFRAGVCYAYPVFNVLSRRQLRLRELPLTAMEVSWMIYQAALPDDMLRDWRELLQTVRRYQGSFVLLWHNSMFTPEWRAYSRVYREFLSEL
jgi:hypothetical protein